METNSCTKGPQLPPRIDEEAEEQPMTFEDLLELVHRIERAYEELEILREQKPYLYID